MFENLHTNVIDVSYLKNFFWGGAENNPVRSSISDQYRK